MKNTIYIFFKSAKADMFNDVMNIYIDNEKKQSFKAGEEFKTEISMGKHIIEIYMGNKRCYAKKEIDIKKEETFLTYAPSIVYTLKGKIKEVTKEKYNKKRKNDIFYEILILILAIIIYIILKFI